MGAASQEVGVLQGRRGRGSYIFMFLASRIRTSWVCCIPYHTKKKAKENTNALEKVLEA